MSTLVVYYSRKNNTYDIAVDIAKKNDADIMEIDTVENTVGYDGFFNCLKFALSKKKMGLLPYDKDISSYDKIIICAPVWMSDFCRPIIEFAEREKHNISDVDYVLIHMFSDMEQEKAISHMNKILRLEHKNFRSIQCFYGHILKDLTNGETVNDA